MTRNNQVFFVHRNRSGKVSVMTEDAFAISTALVREDWLRVEAISPERARSVGERKLPHPFKKGK